MDINNYISQFNNYQSSINNNYSYNTLNITFFLNSKNKYIYNLKNIYNNNTPNYSRNPLVNNYVYNHKKVISLHKKINSRKNENLKILVKQSLTENNNSIHKNILKRKLLNSEIYNSIEKKAIESFLKKKKNTFLTEIEENNMVNEENNKKYHKKNKLNKKKEKKVIILDRSPNIYNYKKENTKTPTKEIKYITLNKINSKLNESLDIYNLTEISLPCINFSSSLSSLNSDINNKKRLAQTSLSKLKVEVIKKELEERYKNFFEKKEFPIGIVNATFNSFLKNQKYFFLFEDFTKKYLQFLSNEINNNIIILDKLSRQKDELEKENEEKLKKISSLREEIKIFESFNNLYLSLKNKSTMINNSSPRKSPLKSRVSKDSFKRSSVFKGYFKRRESIQIKKQARISLQRRSMTLKSPRKSREIFKNTQEIKEIFEEKENNIYKAYQKYVDSVYNEGRLSLEYTKEKESKNTEVKEIVNDIEQLKKELVLLKIENKGLINYKNFLILKDKRNKKKYSNDYNERDANDIKINKILIKVKDILLNLNINIEKILKIKNLYLILKEKDLSKDVIYKGKLYSKGIFFLKVLEFLYLKLELFEKNCLNDKNLSEKYIKIKAKREKEIKYLKAKKNLMEEKMIEMKKNYDVINKINKIIVLKNRKLDPFYKRYIQDDVIKKRIKLKEYLDKMKLDDENEIYNNYLYY